MSYCYKTKDPAAVKAVKAYFDARRDITEKGNAFAKMFSPHAAGMYGSIHHSLVGVFFRHDKPPRNEGLWTQRDKHGMRRPKSNPKTPAGIALLAKWKKHWPTGSITDSDAHAAVGIEPSFPYRPGMALIKGMVYVETKYPCSAKHLTEILYSEYVKATKEKELPK